MNSKMIMEINFYEDRRYDLSTNEGIKNLADDILFYCKYRVGDLSWNLENGSKTIQAVLHKIIEIGVNDV